MKSGKKNTKTLSYRQRRVIDLWVAGGRKNKAGAIRQASYSEGMARQPHKIFNSPAVQRELELRGYGKKGIENNCTPKKEIDVREGARVGQEPVFDPSLLSEKQISQLKEMLAEIPDIPISPYRGMAQEEISSYVPQGDGADAFSIEAKEPSCGGRFSSNPSSFSSM